MYVEADNLAAHSLAGFQESFVSNKICRFCMAKLQEIPLTEVSGRFSLRAKQDHDQHVVEVQQDAQMAKQYWVKGSCPLNHYLEHFHVVDGFPPDILHEGVIPSELCLCIEHFIKKKYFTLDMLYSAIKEFPYAHSDKTNQPQVISKAFHTKGTIGGNGHENWTLLRLLPLIIGHYIPEGDKTWEVILCLKDVLEIAMSTMFTEETLQYLDFKLADLLQKAFLSY